MVDVHKEEIRLVHYLSYPGIEIDVCYSDSAA